MSGKYQVDFGKLDKATVKQLKGIGIDVKKDAPKEDKPDRGMYITGKSNYPIKVVFKQGVEVVGSDAIGNTTTVNAKINSYDWTFKGKSGVGVGLSKVQIVTLSKYERPTEDADFPDSQESLPWDGNDDDDEFDD